MIAASRGHYQVLELLLGDKRVDPNDDHRTHIRAIQLAAREGHISIVCRLMRDPRVDPSAGGNCALISAIQYGRVEIVELLLRDKRVNPADRGNLAVSLAAQNGYNQLVDRLLEDSRVDVAIAVRNSFPDQRKRFERRERFTEICIALQEMQLPAWVTLKILKAAFPSTTLPLHALWALVCAVKHFHDKR